MKKCYKRRGSFSGNYLTQVWSTTRIAFSIAQIGQPPFWATSVDAPPASSGLNARLVIQPLI